MPIESCYCRGIRRDSNRLNSQRAPLSSDVLFPSEVNKPLAPSCSSLLTASPKGLENRVEATSLWKTRLRRNLSNFLYHKKKEKKIVPDDCNRCCCYVTRRLPRLRHHHCAPTRQQRAPESPERSCARARPGTNREGRRPRTP